ncbi:hypothetical protein NIES2119_30360, partial [[Phormidium ambiguum] IAM M-71]
MLPCNTKYKYWCNYRILTQRQENTQYLRDWGLGTGDWGLGKGRRQKAEGRRQKAEGKKGR